VSEHVATSIRHGARTIGDILLELGFVDQERLDAAFERQQVTGQPLGQVLVEVGAITRLELATALAEQWADPSSPGPRWLDDPRSPGTPSGPALTPGDLGEHKSLEPSGLSPRVAALEAAVSELRDSDREPYLAQLQDAVVELARRSAGSEAAAAELAQRVEGSTAALARLRELDAETADTAQRLEAVAAGVEVAVHGLQSDVGEIDTTVQRLSAHVGELAADRTGSDAIEQLRSALEELAMRPAGDPALAARLEDVAARVGALPNASELDELRNAVADLANRPAGDPALADALQELRLVVEGRASSSRDAEIGARVEELGEHVDDLARRHATDLDAAAQLVGLQEQIDGLAAELTIRDGDAAVLATLTETVTELTGRVEALATVAGASVDTEAVDALKSALDELAGRPSGNEGVEARIDALVEHVALLPAATELHELREAVHELAARPAGDPSLAARLDSLATRLEEVAAARDDWRIDELAAQLDTVAARVAADTDERELDDTNDALGNSVAELGARIAEIEARIDTRGDDADQRARIDGVAASLVRLEQALVELAETTPVVDVGAVDALDGRVARLERDRAGGDDLERVARAVEIVRAEVHDRLSSMAAELGGLDGRLRGLSSRPAFEPEAEARVARLELQFGELAATAARHEAGERRVAGSALTGDAAEDIERIRMSIERLGHTIGEQGRAIAELMKMQGGNDVLERLSARVEALEDGGLAPGIGGEGGPPPAGLGTLTRRVDDTDAAVEKLLTQLERMGSSLEWRFRRLEEMVGSGS
jgi:archaellum component FlaC